MTTTDASIYDDLHERVVNGEFEPGQRLKPDDLRSDYGSSASTIRELLFRLSTVGLVDFQEKKGFRVPKHSVQLQNDLTQFRILLESEGACLSIQLGGIAWEARLAASHHKLSHIEARVRSDRKSAELLTLWTSAELEFHQTLIDACGSEILKRTHAVIYQQFRQQLIRRDREFVFVPENIKQHKGILDAALSHNVTLIRKRIADHLARNFVPPLPEIPAERA